MEFAEWPMLATYTGALTMVVTITQLTKGLKYIKKLPTQVWSYIVALCVLYPAHFFTGQLNVSNAVLIIFNGMLVALASNGGFEALKKVLPNLLSNGPKQD